MESNISYYSTVYIYIHIASLACISTAICLAVWLDWFLLKARENCLQISLYPFSAIEATEDTKGDPPAWHCLVCGIKWVQDVSHQKMQRWVLDDGGGWRWQWWWHQHQLWIQMGGNQPIISQPNLGDPGSSTNYNSRGQRLYEDGDVRWNYEQLNRQGFGMGGSSKRIWGVQRPNKGNIYQGGMHSTYEKGHAFATKIQDSPNPLVWPQQAPFFILWRTVTERWHHHGFSACWWAKFLVASCCRTARPSGDEEGDKSVGPESWLNIFFGDFI